MATNGKRAFEPGVLFQKILKGMIMTRSQSHLAAFEPGNSRNTVLRLAAEVLGIPISDMPRMRHTSGGNMEERSVQNEINSSILSKSAPSSLRAGDVMFPRPEKTVEGYLNGSAEPGVYSRLRKSYFDENSSKKRLGAQLRSPHVVYDAATNMIDRLEGGRNPAYYDEDTEQYIIDATQKRANPRYEYLLPQEAEIKQREWKRRNYRFGQDNDWNPMQFLYGWNDGYTRNVIGDEQEMNKYKNNTDRQKREDKLIADVAKLSYNNAYDGGLLYNSGRGQMRQENLAGDIIQETPDLGDILMQRRLELEKQPLSYFAKSKRVNEIKRKQGLSILDAIEKAKRGAIQAYGDSYSEMTPANLIQKIVGSQIEDPLHRNVYDGIYNGIRDIHLQKRAEEDLRKYLFE